MRTTTRRASTLAAAAAIFLTMAACSNGDSAAEPATKTSSPPVEKAENPTPEETTEAPEPKHGDLITGVQAENLPDGLVALHLGSATELVAVDGTQPLPEAVVSYIQDITPAEPEPMDLSDPNTVVYAGDDLLFELHRISETTGRRATTVFNVGTHDENGAVTGDAWVAQFHSELSELALADQAEGVFGTNSFQPTAEEALAQLEDNIARLEDPSVWEIIPPRP